MDYLGVFFLVAILNISLTIWIISLIAKPVFCRCKKRHISFTFTLLTILIIQTMFF